MLYALRPTQNDIIHYGKGHDDSPPGRGSGRYAWGSGKKTSSTLASHIYNNAQHKEPIITKNVKQAAEMSGSKMHGLEHRLKTKESIQRKIETDSKEKNISLQSAASDIKDAVRYTTISNDDNFVSGYEKMKDLLGVIGYKEVRCKNYFQLYKEGKAKHKSVQSVFQDPNGYKFEIQFHTPSSQLAKDKKLPIYEERRKPGLSREQQIKLEKQMDDLAKQVTEPKNISRIKTH